MDKKKRIKKRNKIKSYKPFDMLQSNKKLEKVEGILSKHKNGFGFLIRESEDDIFIPASKMKEAMDGDLVTVAIIPEPTQAKSVEGWVVDIKKRNTTKIFGTFQESKKFGFVIPEDLKMKNNDIFISKNDFGSAKDGDKVVVQIKKYADSKNSAEGKIIEIVSKKNDKDADIKILARKNGLNLDFDNNLKHEAKIIKKNFDKLLQLSTLETSDEIKIDNRVYLDDRIIVTIDGADSKDLDDAISLNTLSNGNYLLGVHIADVSHYVLENSLLDKEAFARGTSVYLMNTVIPMLPKELSNGICSLNPNERRLTLSLDMEINKNGDVVTHKIYESAIKSNYRLVYDDVSDILENNDELLSKKYQNILPLLKDFESLSKILRHKRDRDGSIDFDLTESSITLDQKGVPLDVCIMQRRTANKMIEEFMLVANQTIAEHHFWMDLPFVYRVHETPDEDKIKEFRNFIKNFGIIIKGNIDNIHPKILSDMMLSIKGEPYENVVNSILLRTMKKAFYSPECEGHFGLGMKYYCHFTSPIRRYPDLIIHRIIKESLKRIPNDIRLAELTKICEIASDQSSTKERQAQELERQVEKMKKTEYMTAHLFEPFDGIISGVSNYGFYVELQNTIEGLVKLNDLKDDYYSLQEAQYRIVGEKTGKVFSLGDTVRVEAVRASIEDREIDFVLID